jgi:hypothetical protein
MYKDPLFQARICLLLLYITIQVCLNIVLCNVCVFDKKKTIPSVKVKINHMSGNGNMHLFLAHRSTWSQKTTVPLRLAWLAVYWGAVILKT